VFFTKGGSTERVWFYDLSAIKVGKTRPLTSEHFAPFLELYSTKADSDRSWSVDRATIDANGFNLKAIDPRIAEHEADASTTEILAAMREDYLRLGEALEELDAAIAEPIE